MLTINYTISFKKDYQREKRSGHFSEKIEKEFLDIVELLCKEEPLPKRCVDHSLIGKWKDHRDCHIRPDLVLIYRKLAKDTLDLVRIGSHNQLGL